MYNMALYTFRVTPCIIVVSLFVLAIATTKSFLPHKFLLLRCSLRYSMQVNDLQALHKARMASCEDESGPRDVPSA